MLQPQLGRARQILLTSEFRELSSGRARLRWGLSLLTLLMFFGFLALISSAKQAFGASVPGSIVPIGLVVVLAMSAAIVGLTGIYVQRSNSRFDGLSRALKQEFEQ